ncbi:MAG: hypothetical protein WC565_05500 [Parcubacteria group bacterium]
MNWRKSVADIKQEFGALGAGIEEIVAAAQEEVWEKMRDNCPWKVGATTCDHGSTHKPSKGIYGGTCAFDSCPLLKEAKR